VEVWQSDAGSYQKEFQFSNTNGSFEIEDVPPGFHLVTVFGPRIGEPLRKNIPVVSGQTTHLGELRAVGVRRVSGRVLGPDNRPAANALIVLSSAHRMVESLTTTFDPSSVYRERKHGRCLGQSDEKGWFVLDDASNQDLVAYADHPVLGRSAPVRVPSGPDQDGLQLHIMATASLEVKLSGQSDAIYYVKLIQQPEDIRFTGMIAKSASSVHFKRLPPGSYLVRVSLDTPGQTGSPVAKPMAPVQLGPGEHQTVQVEFQNL
jgi:hypothetical protein